MASRTSREKGRISILCVNQSEGRAKGRHTRQVRVRDKERPSVTRTHSTSSEEVNTCLAGLVDVDVGMTQQRLHHIHAAILTRHKEGCASSLRDPDAGQWRKNTFTCQERERDKERPGVMRKHSTSSDEKAQGALTPFALLMSMSGRRNSASTKSLWRFFHATKRGVRLGCVSQSWEIWRGAQTLNTHVMPREGVRQAEGQGAE